METQDLLQSVVEGAMQGDLQSTERLMVECPYAASMQAIKDKGWLRMLDEGRIYDAAGMPLRTGDTQDEKMRIILRAAFENNLTVFEPDENGELVPRMYEMSPNTGVLVQKDNPRMQYVAVMSRLLYAMERLSHRISHGGGSYERMRYALTTALLQWQDGELDEFDPILFAQTMKEAERRIEKFYGEIVKKEMLLDTELEAALLASLTHDVIDAADKAISKPVQECTDRIAEKIADRYSSQEYKKSGAESAKKALFDRETRKKLIERIKSGAAFRELIEGKDAEQLNKLANSDSKDLFNMFEKNYQALQKTVRTPKTAAPKEKTWQRTI